MPFGSFTDGRLVDGVGFAPLKAGESMIELAVFLLCFDVILLTSMYLSEIASRKRQALFSN